MKLRQAAVIIFAILLIDQLSKLYVKTSFILNEEFSILPWFKIVFIENEGMAWGTKIPGEYGKLILTTFRILAVIGIGYWLNQAVFKRRTKCLIVAISLIFAGALGNIIDSVFYGVLFNDSTYQLATFLSQDNYSSLFHGKVVDMFYFPILDGHFPQWLPFYGGESFRFFNAIFNVADISISTGVGILIVFNKTAFYDYEKSFAAIFSDKLDEDEFTPKNS